MDDEVMLCMFRRDIVCEEWRMNICRRCGWYRNQPDRLWELRMALQLYMAMFGRPCKNFEELHLIFRIGDDKHGT
ncbi:MAG: hypothetical protein HUJ95_01890 [Bacteroidales bacterium]|nr:hypothetical protein [Bacteroidales bacterium]